MFRKFLPPASIALGSDPVQIFPGGTPAVVTIQAPTTNKYSAFYGTSGAGKQIVELVPGATHVRELVNPCDLYAVGTSGDAIVAAAEAAV